MEEVCYLCNKKADECSENLFELHSKYTKTLVIDFFKRFLDGFPTQRKIEDPQNRLCEDCLSNVNEFDCMLMTVAKKESELRRLLVGTERLFNRHHIEIDAKVEKFQSKDLTLHEIDQTKDPKECTVSVLAESGMNALRREKGKRFNIKLKKPAPNSTHALQSLRTIYLNRRKNSVKLRAPTQPRTQCLECNDGVWYTRWDYKVSLLLIMRYFLYSITKIFHRIIWKNNISRAIYVI